MRDELDIVEGSRPRRELAPRAGVVVSLLCCAAIVGVGSIVLATTHRGSDSGGAEPVVVGALDPSISSGPTEWFSAAPSRVTRDACGCPIAGNALSTRSLSPALQTLDPTTLASASYPQSETWVGPATPGTDWRLQDATVWPQVLLAAGSDGTIAEVAPVDAHGSPVFPTAQLGQIQTVQGEPDPVAFVLVTLTTQPRDRQSEFEVAHIQIYDRLGDYSFSPSDFYFESSGEVRRYIEPSSERLGAHPLRAATLHSGESVAGDLVFDVPVGGGDLFLTVWSRDPSQSFSTSVVTKRGFGSIAIVGAAVGPWHTDT